MDDYTGWSGGPYGVGKRIKLAYTRAMITAVLEDKLTPVDFAEHPVFGMMMPLNCPGVPAEILNPENTWLSKEEYATKAKQLAGLFICNFEKYKSGVSEDVLAAAPKI